MEFVTLGKTKLLVSRTAFGAESLDCKEIEAFGDYAEEKASALVHYAYDAGINFFDISHSRPICEKRLGLALHGIRQNVILATKSAANTPTALRKELSESLLALETDTIDLYQLENPESVPEKDSPLYSELLKMQKEGIVRHIGLATENIDIAKNAIESGLYEVVQFPFNMLSSPKVALIAELCVQQGIGCIAAKPMCGGLVNGIVNSTPLAFGFFRQYEHIIPVWGVHTQEELQQILFFESHPPVIDEQFKKAIEQQRLFFS